MVFPANPLPVDFSARDEVLESGRLTPLRDEGRCMAEREDGRLTGGPREDILDLPEGFGLTRPPVSVVLRLSMLEAGRRVLLDCAFLTVGRVTRTLGWLEGLGGDWLSE